MNASGVAGLILLIFAGVGQGFAAGMRDFVDSWLVPSAAVRELLLRDSQVGIVSKNFWGSMGQGRLFELQELEQKYVGLGLAVPLYGTRLDLSGCWEQTGTDLLVENRLEFRFLLGKSTAWGLSGTWFRRTLGHEPQSPLRNASLLWQVPFSWAGNKGHLSLQWPVKVGGNPLWNQQKMGCFKATLRTKTLAITLALDRSAFGEPSPGFQIFWAVGERVGLEWRVDVATGSLGPGLNFLRGPVLVRTSHVVHPQLGLTHRIMVVVGSPSVVGP